MKDLFSPEYKITTTIWILSSNDKVPQMTIEGIIKRTGFSENEITEVIRKFPALFQNNIPKKQFESWKEKMLDSQGRSKWIASSENIENTINSLDINKVFRNRLRNGIEYKTLETEELKWGLEFITNYYELTNRQRTEKRNRLQLITIPILSLLIAGLSIFHNFYSDNQKMNFEVVKYKQSLIKPSYSKFIESLNSSLNSFSSRNRNSMFEEISNMENALIDLYPFVDSLSFKPIKMELDNYTHLLYGDINNPKLNSIEIKKLTDKYIKLKYLFTEEITSELKKNN